MQYFRMWHAVWAVLQNMNMFVSFITVTLWQNTWDNELDERFILGHGFRGFIPWSTHSIAPGPAKEEASWHGAQGTTKLLTSWQPRSKRDGGGVGVCVHSSSVFMQPILQVSVASLLCASFFIYWTHGVHRIQGRAFIEYCSVVFIKLHRRIILFHFTVERNNIEEGWIICPGSLVSQVVKAGVESRSCRLLKPLFIQLLSTLPRPSPFSLISQRSCSLHCLN